MSRAGVLLLAGSDSGASNAGTFPGFSLHDELAQLVKAGLTPIQAIQCATRNPAVWMKQDGEMGSVEAGKLADLVLLDDNPLKDIRSTRKIRAVIFNGRLFDRNQLDQMLSAAEAIAKSQE
jgi:imidazolonepropionase-like amidohydrolase